MRQQNQERCVYVCKWEFSVCLCTCLSWFSPETHLSHSTEDGSGGFMYVRSDPHCWRCTGVTVCLRVLHTEKQHGMKKTKQNCLFARLPR